MIKYKIVGVINLLFGIFQLLVSIVPPFFVIPKLTSLYSEFNVSSGPNLFGGYLVSVLIFLVAVANLFLGVKGLTSKKDNDRYFKSGIILEIVSLLLTGILVGFLTISIIFPIYNLTSNF